MKVSRPTVFEFDLLGIQHDDRPTYNNNEIDFNCLKEKLVEFIPLLNKTSKDPHLLLRATKNWKLFD